MEKIKYFVLLFLCANFWEDVSCRKHGRLANATDGGKIVGGYSTTIEDVPYQVYVLLKKGNDYYQCGGSIVNSRHILTAAHCLTDIEMAYVRAGSTNSDSGGTMFTSSRLIQHPRYNAQTSDYDVGVIRLSQSMQLGGDTMKATKLPQQSSQTPAANTEVLVSGWGTTSENGQTSTTLMAVKVPTVSNAECRRSYGNSISNRMFCAGVPEGGKDSCQGDSGGPSVQTSDGTQLGIVSFGMGCARAGYPGVYTNVASVRSWIRSNTGT